MLLRLLSQSLLTLLNSLLLLLLNQLFLLLLNLLLALDKLNKTFEIRFEILTRVLTRQDSRVLTRQDSSRNFLTDFDRTSRDLILIPKFESKLKIDFESRLDDQFNLNKLKFIHEWSILIYIKKIQNIFEIYSL